MEMTFELMDRLKHSGGLYYADEYKFLIKEVKDFYPNRSALLCVGIGFWNDLSPRRRSTLKKLCRIDFRFEHVGPSEIAALYHYGGD